MKLANNKGSSFFALILAMLIFGSMGLATVSFLSANLVSSTDNLQGTQSFYVAEGGLHHTIMNEFNLDPDFSDNISPTDLPFGTNSVSINPGEFWVEYLNQAPSSVDVKVTGKVGGTVRVVRQTVAKEYEYIVLAGGNFNAASGSGSLDGVLGTQGTVNIGPAINHTGTTLQAANMGLPTANLQVYDDMTTQTHAGNKNFISDYTGNLHVTGDVTFQNNMTYNGVLYVEGNVDFLGQIDLNGTLVTEGNINAVNINNITLTAQPINANEHMPSIICMGNIDFSKATNLNIYGLVWSNGVINLTDSVNLTYEGSLISTGNNLLNSSNSFSLTFNKTLVTGVPGLSLDRTVATMNLSNWKFN